MFRLRIYCSLLHKDDKISGHHCQPGHAIFQTVFKKGIFYCGQRQRGMRAFDKRFN